MKKSIITWVVVLGTVAITGIIAMQSYWVISMWNLNEDEFNKKVNLALFNVARSLAELNQTTLPARNIIRRRNANYYVVNIEDEISPINLEYYLQKELESLALNVDFEYAVFDCTTDEMVYGNYCSYNPRSNPPESPGDLPKVEGLNYYFGVKFPTRPGYLFGKMQLALYFSALLLITFIFFAYSLFVILRQRRLSEMQKDFINNMTHEFKTPLSTIKIGADVFLQDPYIKENPRLQKYASIISEQNQRLNTQVEKVLQLAKIERGNFQLKQEPVLLQPFLEKVAASARVKIDRLDGCLTTDFDAAMVTIKADTFHFTNILDNLLDNAIKYRREEPLIQMAATRENRLVTLSVTDNGIGISEEHHHRVFDKFYRVPTGNIHNVKGFGLGLFYVRNICQAHGWRIRISSQPGHGTTIRISLPVIKGPDRLKQSGNK